MLKPPAEAALAERVHHGGELREQVAGEQPGIAEALRDATPGGGVEINAADGGGIRIRALRDERRDHTGQDVSSPSCGQRRDFMRILAEASVRVDRKSTRLNSSHITISYAVFCLKK